MSAIEIIALVLVIISAIKIAFLLINPKAWFHSVGKFWMKPGVATIFALVVGGVVLKYLLDELTIVQIFAVMALHSLLFWIMLAPYKKDWYDMATRELSSGKLMKKNALGLLIWIVLALWVLKTIFA